MREYHVVALSVPIVYNNDGDHDPDGMLFAPRAHAPLLRWMREQWEFGDGRLPRLHLRRQYAQIVVDAFDLLDRQLHGLRSGPDEDLELLAELLRRETVPSYGEPEDRLSHGPRRRSHRPAAVRKHVEGTLDVLRNALSQLGDEHPPGTVPDPGEEAAAPGWEPGLALVSLDPQTRQAWRDHWAHQLGLLDDAIAQWFDTFEKDADRRFDADRLQALVLDETGVAIPAGRIRRLLLNDHRVRPTPGTPGPHPFDRFNPMRPVPLVEPLVLRTRAGEELRVTVENSIRDRRIGFHVQGDGIGSPEGAGVRFGDGCHAGDNPDTTIGHGDTAVHIFAAAHEGVWPVNDLADLRGSEQGTNARGLFGTVVVEPPGVTWHDPVDGQDLTETGYGTGLYVDVHRPGEPVGTPEHQAFVDFHHDDVPRSFREFTVFIHDQPAVHSAFHLGEHTVMPLSYRAEPMENRVPHRVRRLVEATSPAPARGQAGVDRTAFASTLGPDLQEEFWTARTPDGRFLERVSGEEQHHSSWLSGDPVTPLLRAYKGDPYRIRLVHAGVKETHVFHLHVHQWRAVAADTRAPSTHGSTPGGDPLPLGSQLLDSITIGPQTGFTIDPQYGAGSRQHAMGDIIWHCHLYPHFHHGMWGLLRSYDRFVDGTHAYPDGMPCQPLQPLPGRDPEPRTAEHPGFPWFVDGEYPMKSPPPPGASDESRNGRRLLLDLPLHTPHEYAAMHPACRDGSAPGALFVDLDGDAARWNADAGLPAPRIVSYDLEVVASDIVYNADGWHDPRGHHYRLLKATIREPLADGTWETTAEEVFATPHGVNPEPLFPRANHGDIVEWRFVNALGSFDADGFDLAQHPVECGLHVHLVKFDALAADGSASGWNYLSGASCREAVGSDHGGEQRTVSLHRWVVDEQFGPCFFHDHLLANYRQKHGLSGALIAQPHGSQWWRADDQDRIAWGDPQAVIVPPVSSGLPPYRDACLSVGDFVPLLDEGGRPLNPPSTLSGDDDPGSMAVNYRSAPLTHRGDDPSLWFANEARSKPSLAGVPGDPDTPVIRAYPGERLRIRLIQGSHEEQHTFSAHGLRWRSDWGNPRSPLAAQRTLGISEAFTLDIGAPGDRVLTAADHLWQFAAMDDLWTGCWGFVRVLRPNRDNLATLSPLPDLDDDPTAALARLRSARSVPPRPQPTAGEYGGQVQTFVVVARRKEHLVSGKHLTDPWGLHFHVADYRPEEHRAARDSGIWRASTVHDSPGPLVLRARRGQWVRVFLVNDILSHEDVLEHQRVPFGVETSPPRLPLEHLDAFGVPDRRTVSPRVSLHPSLLSYDVDAYDGAYIGRNHDGTVAPVDSDEGGHGMHEEGGKVVHREGHDHDVPNWTEYWWYCDERLAPASYTDGPGAVCHLQDMADVRNHRHHGLVGALVVEPGDVQAFRPGSRSSVPDGEHGSEVELRTADGGVVARECVVFVQDGLRLYVNGHPLSPVRDVNPADDPEDSGLKALSWRAALVHHGVPPHGADADPPLLTADQGDQVWLRVVCAADKPRQHSVVVHGASWNPAPWVPGAERVGAVGGVAPGWARTLAFTAALPGDHVVRTGCFQWGTEQGLWGLLRVRPATGFRIGRGGLKGTPAPGQ